MLSRWAHLAWTSPTRALLGFLAGLISLAALTVVITPERSSISLASVSLLFLVPIVAVAAFAGTLAALATSIGAFLLVSQVFSPQGITFTHVRDIVLLAVFLLVASVISNFVSLAARRTADARRARSAVAILAQATAALLEMPDPLPELVSQVRATFGLSGVSLLRRGENGWSIEAASGSDPPPRPEDGVTTIEISQDEILVLGPPHLRADDREVLDTFVSHIGISLRGRRLQGEAATAAALAEVDKVRTALLAAVSHDLRTPLASIKAASTSLLDKDITWPSETARNLIDTIDHETDRLTVLVRNLLDMSRLQAGSLGVHLRPSSAGEMVEAALADLQPEAPEIAFSISGSLPQVLADPPLLVRALANIISNAVTATDARPNAVRIAAAEVPQAVEIRVIDVGAGIAPRDRERIFLPFQRMGDEGSGPGVGLGLAVARGFVEATGGTLWVEDTPGGGTTMVVRVPSASGRSAQHPAGGAEAAAGPQTGGMGAAAAGGETR